MAAINYDIQNLMHRRARSLLTMTLLGSVFCSRLFAADLVQTYRAAAAHSPTLHAAMASKLSSGAGISIAASNLLPAIDLTANVSANASEQSSKDYTYGQAQGALSVSMPLFNASDWANVASAKQTAIAASHDYQATQQQFMLNVATAYFNVLSAKDQVDYLQAEIQFLTQSLKETKAGFQAGTKTIVDYKQSEASLSQAKAELIDAQNTLLNRRTQLTAFVGYRIDIIEPLKAHFPLKLPNPASPYLWTRQAMHYNETLQSAQHQAQAAQDHAVSVTTNAFIPDVSLVASASDHQYMGSEPTNSPRYNYSVGITATWTPFAGGANWFESLQAAKQSEATYSDAIYQMRETRAQTYQDYDAVISAMREVQAYQQSVKAAKVALKQFEARYRANVSTIVDVLDQVQKLTQARESLSNAKYQYILAMLQLKLDAGKLSMKSLEQVNQLLAQHQSFSIFHLASATLSTALTSMV